MKEFFKGKIGNIVRKGVLAGASLAIGSEELKGSQKAIAEARQEVAVAEHNLKKAKELPKSNTEKKQKIDEAELELVKAKGGLDIALGEDADEREKAGKEEAFKEHQPYTDDNFGRPYEKEKDLGVSSVAKVELGEDGKILKGEKIVGKLSKEQMKHEREMAKIEASVKKEEAKAKRPVVVPGAGHYGGVYGSVTGRHSHIIRAPYSSRNSRGGHRPPNQRRSGR